MARATIVTDSAAELSPDTIEELGIAVLPLRIHLGDQVLTDSPEFRTPSFHEASLKNQVAPTVSPPSADAFRELYRRLASEGQDIVSIHSSTLPANTVRPARQAAETLLGRLRVEVVDATYMSVAMGLIVEEAARAALQGATGAQIVRLLRGVVPRTYLGLYVDDLAYLRRSGALAQSSMPAGATTAKRPARPILIMEEGAVAPQYRVRSKGTPAERLVDFVMEFMRIKRLVLIHSGLVPDVTEIKAELTERLQVDAVREAIYGPATAAAIGPKAVGAVVMEH